MFEGAFYLAGYSVECGLKACIAKLTNQYDFPGKNTQRDCYTHDFETLIKTAGIATMFEMDRRAIAELDANWMIVRRWREDCRYDPAGSKSEADVRALILAITDTQHGVLSWVKHSW